ncbi:MAG: hypothetical protein ACSLE1_12775 [Sphingobium sp.]
MSNVPFGRKIINAALHGLGVCATPILVVGVASVAAVVFILDKVHGGRETPEHKTLSAGSGVH